MNYSMHSHAASMIQGMGYYNGESVTIIGSHGDKLLIIASHNPIQSEWVIYTELSNVTWYIHTNVA